MFSIAKECPLKKVAILQSNYIPWKGYFDLMASVDEFILYDDMQFTRRDWRNRNQIKTPNGLQWLTVPVRIKGRYHQSIRETEIEGAKWPATHLTALKLSYSRSPCYREVSSLLEPLYLATNNFITPLNRSFIETICDYLGIRTTISNSWDYKLSTGRSERLLDLCLQANADVYVSGPAAKNYLDESIFEAKGIQVEWFDYSGYPDYPQLWGEFNHHVSIVDLLFNMGQDSADFMKFPLSKR